METKRCAKHDNGQGAELPVSAFGKDSGRKTGLQTYCRECVNAAFKIYQREHPEWVKERNQRWKDNNREHWLKYSREYISRKRREQPERFRLRDLRQRCKKYGVTVEWYDEQYAKQNGVCAICKNACKSGRQLAVDHSHSTEAVRGLLCADCNGALARLEADETWAHSAIKYLTNHR